MNFNKDSVKILMIRPNEKGLTLVELLVTITIMVIIAAAAIPLLSTGLHVHAKGTARSRLYHEGLMLMEKMTSSVRKTSYLQIPNSHKPDRNMLAVANLVNEDNDFYFGDPLFPRVDEDFGDDFMWAGYGIFGVDDDGDGNVDDGQFRDDDEDGVYDEEILDGLDNDGDGNIDEDLSIDFTKDNATGIIDMDDDGDGQVDESSNPDPLGDEDEDGQKGEDSVTFVLFYYDDATNTLREIVPSNTSGIYTPDYDVILSTRVTDFTATYYPPDTTNHPRISIALTLTGDDGEGVTFTEYVCPRNIIQRTGKRVK